MTDQGKIQPSSLLRMVAVLVLAYFIGLVVFGAAGVRGTDQYWYVGDLSMHAELGRYSSNLIYPSYSLSHGAELPGPIHHVPVVYVAQLLYALGIPAYAAWVMTNVMAMGLCAVMIFLMARVLRLDRVVLLPALLFISFPLTYWQTVNALADIALAMGAAGLLLGALWTTTSRRRTGLVVAAVSAVFLYWSRDDFTLVLAAFLGFCLWLTVSRGWGKSFVLAVAGACVALAALKPIALPKHPSNGFRGALFNPGSMDFFYQMPEFSPTVFVEKSMSGLVGALVPSSSVEVFTELPVLVALAFGMWATWRDPKYAMVRWWTAVFFVTYVATCMFFQAQNRYILTLLPGTTLLAVGGLQTWLARRPVTKVTTQGSRALIAMTILVFLGVSSLMSLSYRSGAVASEAKVEQLADDLANHTSGPILAIGESAELIQLSYAVHPRPVLAVDPDLNQPDVAADLISKWGVGYLLGSSDELPYLTEAVNEADPGAEVQRLGKVQAPDGDFEVWSID